MTSYVMYICISSSSIIRFQLPKLSRLQYHSPVAPDDSSKHSCWLWTHDVSWVMSIPYLIALQGYPIHYIIVMYMYWPQSSHSAVWIYQSLILKINVMWFAILNDAPPYQSIGWIPSRNKIYYPHTSVYTRRMYIYEPMDHMNCCNSFILYFCRIDIIVYIMNCMFCTNVDVLKWCG